MPPWSISLKIVGSARSSAIGGDARGAGRTRALLSSAPDEPRSQLRAQTWAQHRLRFCGSRISDISRMSMRPTPKLSSGGAPESLKCQNQSCPAVCCSALFGVTYFRRATAPGPRRKRNANQSRESDSRKITGNYRWRVDADCNFPQVQNGMRDEPRRCSSPQLKATGRSDHTDAESCAEEHLNKPN